MIRILGIAAIAGAMGGAASAATWVASQDKGLAVYALQDGTARIDMVCDPEGLWTTPEYHVVVTDGGSFLTGNTIEVSDGPQTLTFPLSGGSILGATAKVEDWNNLVTMLTTPGPVHFTAGSKTVSLTIDAPVNATCARSE